jgi:hypothetical protein
MAFYQRKGSSTYHTMMKCSKVPRNVKTNKDWTVRGSKPRGKMCPECAAKEKPKSKPKRRAARRKMGTARAARRR